LLCRQPSSLCPACPRPVVVRSCVVCSRPKWWASRWVIRVRWMT